MLIQVHFNKEYMSWSTFQALGFEPMTLRCASSFQGIHILLGFGSHCLITFLLLVATDLCSGGPNRGCLNLCFGHRQANRERAKKPSFAGMLTTSFLRILRMAANFSSMTRWPKKFSELSLVTKKAKKFNLFGEREVEGAQLWLRQWPFFPRQVVNKQSGCWRIRMGRFDRRQFVQHESLPTNWAR